VFCLSFIDYTPNAIKQQYHNYRVNEVDQKETSYIGGSNEWKGKWSFKENESFSA
jgi:hypothetical protein